MRRSCRCRSLRIVSRPNIILTGFMGTGKTTVSRVLADRLGYEFVDTDAVISQRHGSIAEIFAELGESEFRRFERQVAAELSERTGLVIATGGRLMIDPVNAEALGTAGRVFCLTASVDTILSRVTHSGATPARPMLDGEDVRQRITDLLTERAEAYARFEQIDTDGHTVDEVVDRILGLVDTTTMTT